MIETIDDGFSHDAIKRPKIGHPTDLRFDGAAERSRRPDNCGHVRLGYYICRKFSYSPAADKHSE